MIILEDIRFYNKTKRYATDAIREAVLQSDLFENVLEEESDEERDNVIALITNDKYVRNDYASFIAELSNNKRKEFLTQYKAEEFERNKVQTYSVPGYEIGFALKPMPDGDVDIISVHNNSDIKGIGEYLIDSAIRLGGTTLDHFDGYLSDFYQNKGFDEYERYKWNDDYAPQGWDYDKYGKPDVVMRRLRK